ncbi:MAG: GNAT family N-acetyltransferase [Coriobacteriia bacterium]|nr:GNAT family N-acetyltransferase [Coriobacteriia bacterium]
MPDARIREIGPEDYPLLEEFLYLAVYQRDPAQPIPRSVIDEPRVRNYIVDFGSRPDDRGLVAEVDGTVVGAAWARVLGGDPVGYGYVDDETPELAISVLPEYRNRGIGTRLMLSLIDLLSECGYARTSLSVDKANYAVKMYEALGFTVVAEQDEDNLMIRELSQKDRPHAG